MSDYKAFYEMVKKWMVKDYRTPHIMAEVTINMLISEFVPEMLLYRLNNDKKRMYLFGKEMPIPTISLYNQDKITDKQYNIKWHEYASADYILADDENVYLAELKTTNPSIRGVQLLNMLWACEQGSKSLYYRWHDLIIHRYLHSSKKKDKFYALKYLHNVKEMYEFAHAYQSCPYDLNSRRAEDVEGAMEDTWKEILYSNFNNTDTPMKIVYISLHDVDYKKDIIDKLPEGKLKIERKLSRQAKGCQVPTKFRIFLESSDELATNYVLSDKNIILSQLVEEDNFTKFVSDHGKALQWEKVRPILSELAQKTEQWFQINPNL